MEPSRNRLAWGGAVVALAGVFDRLESSGAERQAASIAASVAGWSALEAARQCAPAGSLVTKTWVTGRNPRPSHLRMNGETVPIGEPFPNGAMWPGDSRVLPAPAGGQLQLHRGDHGG